MALSSTELQHLTFVFGILGNFVSFGVFLAPLPTFWSIYKKKSTQGFQIIPYSVALFSAMLLLYYALLKESNGMMIITINTFGLIIETFYLTVYLIYAPKKARIYTAKLFGLFNVGFFALIVFTTMVFVHGSDHHKMFSRGGIRESVVGWICGIFSVCVFVAPLTITRMVIRTKSVEFMPFWLSFSLTFCAVLWFLFGFLIKDFYIALPNVIGFGQGALRNFVNFCSAPGFGFGIAQMILYLIYKDSSEKKKQNNNNVDFMIKESDILQLHELAVDIKHGHVDKKDNQNKATADVTEVMDEEMVEGNQNEGTIDNIIRESDDGRTSSTIGIMPCGNEANV